MACGSSQVGVKLVLQLQVDPTATATQDLSFVFQPHHSSRQCWILNPLSETKDRTLILMDTKKNLAGVPVDAQWLTNPTRNLAQWVIAIWRCRELRCRLQMWLGSSDAAAAV